MKGMIALSVWFIALAAPIWFALPYCAVAAWAVFKLGDQWGES